MKHFFTWMGLVLPLLLWAQQSPCESLDLSSNAQVVYGTATAVHSDSVEAQAQAVASAKQLINSQLVSRLKYVAATYVTEFNSPDSHNDVVKALKRIEAAADRVMDQTTTECVQADKDEENNYAITVVEQIQADNLFRYIAANYNDRIINIDRFKDIWTSYNL